MQKSRGGNSKTQHWLRRSDRCATTLEFAFVAMPFFVMILGVMEIGYDLYIQEVLDNLATTVARSVQVGSATGTAAETSLTFVSNIVCPGLGNLLDCSRITAAVAPVPPGSNYYTAPVQQQLTQLQAITGQGICTGLPDQMMVLRLWYDGPTFLGVLVPAFATAWNGMKVHEATASAGFVNEYFTIGGQSAGSACSL